MLGYSSDPMHDAYFFVFSYRTGFAQTCALRQGVLILKKNKNKKEHFFFLLKIINMIKNFEIIIISNIIYNQPLCCHIAEE